jgi:hypothetical protein
MAIENDRIIKGQIRLWAPSILGTDPTTLQEYTPTDLSLSVARLLGAAMPLGYLQMTEPESFTKLRGEILRSFPIWSSDGGPICLFPPLAELRLDVFLRDVQVLFSSPDEGSCNT